ncbi:hypothetical protein ACHAXN_000325, partial [Cyclotella atomus]
MGIFVADEKLNVVKDSLRVGRNTKGFSRGLSVDLGDGACKWTEPMREVPEELDLWKTLLVGFPSGDKRMAWVQMEALSGLPSKDDWDFVFNGYSNAPFIKTNYPHPSAVWSWDSEADQVALVLQFICRSMVEYCDIMWYHSFEDSYNKERVVLEDMYGQRNHLNDFYGWRDANALLEIYKYGWYIDFYMENGQYRDPYNHEAIRKDEFELYKSPDHLTNDRHLSRELKTDRVTICHRTSSATNPCVEIRIPDSYVELHRDHGDFIGTCEDAMKDPNFMNGHINPPNCGADTQDLNCDKITNFCRPVTIISPDRLRDFTEGPKETEIIGNILMSNEKTAQYIIDKETRPCIWTEVIYENKGPMTFDDRDISSDPNFSEFMLQEML